MFGIQEGRAGSPRQNSVADCSLAGVRGHALLGVYNKWLHDNRYNSDNEFIMHEEGTHADNIAPGPCTDGGGPADIWESPFTGLFRGCTWNCRSLWSKRSRRTYEFVMKLAEAHDYVVLTETRETEARRQYTLDALPKDFIYFTSGIGARKGGISIIMKRSFLDQFSVCPWEVAEAGRVASLTLKGRSGTLNIIPVYLDPTGPDLGKRANQGCGLR